MLQKPFMLREQIAAWHAEKLTQFTAWVKMNSLWQNLYLNHQWDNCILAFQHVPM